MTHDLPAMLPGFDAYPRCTCTGDPELDDCVHHPPAWCAHCGYDGDYFMLRDDVWRAAATPSGVAHKLLCLACVERALGRPLTNDDFTDCEVNRWLLRDIRTKENQ